MGGGGAGLVGKLVYSRVREQGTGEEQRACVERRSGLLGYDDGGAVGG